MISMLVVAWIATAAATLEKAVELPTVELRSLSTPTLASAFEQFGAVSVEGIDVDVILNAVREVFEVSEVEKRSSASSPSDSIARGYIFEGGESGSVEYVEAKEGFSFGHSDTPNRWPPINRTVLEHAFVELCAASKQIVDALTSKYPSLDGCCDKDADSASLARLFRYFPVEEERRRRENILGSSPHTDWGMLTFVLTRDTQALEIWHQDSWRPVVARSGVVVNAGDYLSLASGGASHSPRHRVVSSDRERLSFVFFYYPNHDAVIPAASSHQDLSLLECQQGDDAAASCANAALPLGTQTFGDYIEMKWREVARGGGSS